MNAATSQQQQPLLSQIDAAQEDLGGLEHSLRAIDGELEQLAVHSEQYEAAAAACGSLERLAALGGTELFWGDGVDGSEAARRVSDVRARVAAFALHVAEVRERRAAVAGEVAQGREVLSILEDDLQALQDEQEEASHEWIVEREVEPTVARAAAMPWTRGCEDDRRFRRSLGSALAAALLVGLLLPLIDLPLPEPAATLEVPERVVELIRRDQRRSVPPPAAIVEERVEPPPPEPEPEVQPEPQPLVAEQVVPTEVVPAAAPAPEPLPRERAQSAGILAFRESFSALADNRPSARLGSDARISNAGDAAIGRPERSMVTTEAPGSSGGINLAALSRNVGGGGDGGPQMAGVTTTRVASSIGPGGGGRTVGAGEGAGAGLAGRTDEEIQIVFDRHKAALYRFYNRELRNNPALRGQMVLRLTIEPDGRVSLCELQSTDMNAPALAEQVLERVRTFDFGAKDVAALTIVYPIDFLPAA